MRPTASAPRSGGKESRAAHVGLDSLVIKAAYILGPLLIVLLGFKPSAAHQSALSILTLKGAGLLLPCAMMLVGAAVVWSYPLDRARTRAIQRRLARREEGPAAANWNAPQVTPEVAGAAVAGAAP